LSPNILPAERIRELNVVATSASLESASAVTFASPVPSSTSSSGFGSGSGSGSLLPSESESPACPSIHVGHSAASAITHTTIHNAINSHSGSNDGFHSWPNGATSNITSEHFQQKSHLTSLPFSATPGTSHLPQYRSPDLTILRENCYSPSEPDPGSGSPTTIRNTKWACSPPSSLISPSGSPKRQQLPRRGLVRCFREKRAELHETRVRSKPIVEQVVIYIA
ncbi:unnamed protein product, partial [Protopolystoma xenopodis]